MREEMMDRKGANMVTAWTIRGNTVMHNIAVMADCKDVSFHFMGLPAIN